MPICSTCGSRQPDGAAFCDECGAALSAPPIAGWGGIAGGIPTVAAALCPVCGAQVAPGEVFCNSCGASLGASPGSGSPAAVPPTVVAPPVGAPTCAKCGTVLEPDSAFCDMCGAPVQAVTPPYVPVTPPPVSPLPAYTPSAPAEAYPPTVLVSTPEVEAYSPSPAVVDPALNVFTPAPPVGPPITPTPVPQVPVYTPPPAIPRGKLLVSGMNIALPFPAGKTQIILGREDPVSGIFPDIDLTDYGGDEGGVSRQHARIVIQGETFFIEDLNSTNFTFVNQQKLLPRQPQRLNDGDEVRLGRVKLIFQVSV